MGVHAVVPAAISSSQRQQQRYHQPPIDSSMFPPSTDNDDTQSNKPWGGRKISSSPVATPSPRRRQSELQDGHPTPRSELKAFLEGQESAPDPSKKKKSLWDLVALTVSMAGAQIAWTVELGYGTPFLLSLGLSEQLTSLVWLAGPISGLIAQPLIGAISDSSTSRYRRRYWVVTSTAVLVFSALVLAYAQAVAIFLVGIFGGGEGSWDEKWKKQVQNTAIGLAVTAFYLLDFALNALQGSLRNLLLDVTPAEQLGKANAWHGRMIHIGNIIGFTVGFVNLADWWILNPLGGTQFRKLCIVAIAVLVLTVWITCFTQPEKERQKEAGSTEGSGMREAFDNIVHAIGTLPRPVRRVCYVQVCAFMGWFPFLFYSTTWVGEIMAYEIDKDPSEEVATRAGEFALLIYSVVAVVAGTGLPYLASLDARLLKQIDKEMENEDEEVDAEISKIKEMVRHWKAEAARKGKPLLLPRMPFMLRNIWTAALVLFGVIMMTTFFITTVFQATIAIALLGVCWAVACWVPFAIIMQFLKEMDDNAAAERKSQEQARNFASGSGNPRGASLMGRPLHARIASSPLINNRRPSDAAADVTERTPLMRRHSMMELYDPGEEDIGYVGTKPVAGGTILGIHNLAIVIPQFLIALISSAIFRIVDQHQRAGPGGGEYLYYGKNGVSWVLRFGGLCAFVGAAISRRVPPTKVEKEMRWRLAEMKENERLEAA